MNPDYILPFHLLTLAFVVWTIVQADHLGMRWIFGKDSVLNEKTVRKHHRNTWLGLSGMILTGFLMFWPMREFLLHRPQFWLKMFFVGTLVVNGFVIGRLQNIATHKPYASLTLKEKLPIFISGAASSVAWIGAGITAFFLLPD
jgi:hypothetical protein